MPVGNALNAVEAGIQCSDGLGTWKGRKIIGVGAVTTTNQDGIAGDIQISVTPGAMPTEVVTTATKTAVINTSYIANNAAGVTFTLPSIAPLGSVVEVVYQSGSWKVVPATTQQILYGTIAGTVTTGTLTSKNIGDCIRLKCTVTNSVWTVVSDHGQIELT